MHAAALGFALVQVLLLQAAAAPAGLAAEAAGALAFKIVTKAGGKQLAVYGTATYKVVAFEVRGYESQFHRRPSSVPRVHAAARLYSVV
jgi:hypothetical protein